MLADAFVVAVVVIAIVIGYKMGFLKSVISVVSYVASIILSFLFYPILSDFLVKTPIYPFFVEKLNKNYLSAEKFALSEDGFFASYLNKGIESAAEGIAGAMAQLLINIIAFVIIIILSKIAIRLIAKALNVFTKLPVIKQFNRLGGAIAGAFMGVLVVYMVFALAVVISPLKADSKVMAEIEKSSFASEMYENNILLELLNKEEKV